MTIGKESCGGHFEHDPGCPFCWELETKRVAHGGIVTATEVVASQPKPVNPKDRVGVRKARWFSYIPLRVLVGVGLSFLEGALKYGKFNWRLAGVKASVYVDACVSGHLMPWMEGEEFDPVDGSHHLDNAIASLIILRDSMIEGNWTDDRQKPTADWPALIDPAHTRAAKMIDKYAELNAARAL